MAVQFFDSSALVKRYVNEAGSAWVLTLVDPSRGHQSYVARITGAEITAAVAARARAGTLFLRPTLTLITSDGALNTAAAAEGVTVADPNSHP